MNIKKLSREHQTTLPAYTLIEFRNYIKLFASARISSPIASAASCVGPSE